MLSLLVAVDKELNIDLEGRPLVELPSIQHLLSTKHVIMGRKTYAEYGHSLRGEMTVYLSRYDLVTESGYLTSSSDTYACSDLDKACDIISSHYQQRADIVVVGGASLYTQILPQADCIYMIQLLDKKLGSRLKFPADWNDKKEWELVFVEKYEGAVDPHYFAVFHRKSFIDKNSERTAL